MLIDTVRYELPPEGITLLGYIVRRMHKTERLLPVPDLLAQGKSFEALEQIALYTAAASASYGRAYYQPTFDATGATVREPDPVTGAIVTARLESRSPHYHITYEVNLPDGDRFQGSETITGTTVGLRGLGMPAPSQFSFVSGGYHAKLTGTITSELALSLFGHTRIRAYGFLNFEDNLSNTGKLELDRAGDITMTINDDQPTNHTLPATLWLDKNAQALLSS
jgi:hypothetical protein